MKKLGLVALLLLLPLLFACGEGEKDNMTDGFEMKAVVTALGEKIEVDVTEAQYATGPFWIITSSETVFLDKKGDKISKDDINVGDTLVITYNGQVMMSYPPQVVAIEIKKCEF